MRPSLRPIGQGVLASLDVEIEWVLDGVVHHEAHAGDVSVDRFSPLFFRPAFSPTTLKGLLSGTQPFLRYLS